MKVTIASHTVLYNGSPLPAFARVYCNQAFVNEDGQSVPAGVVGSPNYVKQVAVTNNAGVATIAAFSGANQIDSSVNENGGTISDYVLSLHASNGGHIMTLYPNLRVPSDPTSTSWADIVTFNEAHPQPSRFEFYDTLQINSLMGSLGDDIDALRDESVLLTGNQTVAGVKTFSSSPVAPTPTTDFQVATKEYVDGSASIERGSLRFDENQIHHVRCGAFWKTARPYSHFLWEAWIKPRFINGAGYIISDNNGGAHCLLWGTQPINAEFCTITGNVQAGTTASTVSSVDTVNDLIATTANHLMYTGQVIIFSTTGTLPAELTAGVQYYAVYSNDTSIKVATSYRDAVNPTPTVVNLSTAGSGVITITPTPLVSFAPAMLVPYNHDVHVAVGWDGTSLLCWTNGVLTHKQAFGPPYRLNPGGNDGNLYFGGSGHNMWTGNLFQMRGYEGYGRCPERAEFTPDLVFTPDRISTSGTANPDVAEFCMSFQANQKQFVDLGIFEGVSHHGLIETVLVGGDLPVFEPGDIEVGTFVPTPPATPAGAIIWDSFSRANSDPATDTSFVLGAVEVGGVNWTNLDGTAETPGRSGIVNGYAFSAYSAGGSKAVQTSTRNVDVRVNRVPDIHQTTACWFRYKDGNDGYFAYGTEYKVDVFKWEGGAFSVVTYVNTLPGWTTLRCVANGTAFDIYVGTATEGSFTLLGSFVGTNVVTATKAGIIDHGLIAQPLLFDNFLVKAA